MVEITNTIIAEIIKSAFNLLRESLENRGHSTKTIAISLENHLAETVSWSERVQFFGMAHAFNTDNSTIKIDISSIPRKFSGDFIRKKLIDELSLFNDQNHYIILGSPGSGKTTTIKKMSRALIFNEPTSKLDSFQFPIVIRLRELVEGENLFKYISNLLGIVIKKVHYDSITGRRFQQTEFFIGDEKLENELPKIQRFPDSPKTQQ